MVKVTLAQLITMLFSFLSSTSVLWALIRESSEAHRYASMCGALFCLLQDRRRG